MSYFSSNVRYGFEYIQTGITATNHFTIVAAILSSYKNY